MQPAAARHFIAGEWCDNGGAPGDSLNPAVGRFHPGSKALTEEAARVVRAAFFKGETGGYGRSGLGRFHGVDGLRDFLETKHVHLEAGAV